MYEYIEGVLVALCEQYVVVATGGVGYKVFKTSSFDREAPAQGSTVRLYVSWVVREETQTLYGFLHLSERDLFEMLIGLSGIGPRTGLNILSCFTPAALEQAVLGQDIPALIKVPGIGRKTAERMLLDLRGKVFPHTPASTSASAPSPVMRDALQALSHLGYAPAHAQAAISYAQQQVVTPHCDLPTLLKEALKFKKT